MTLEPSQVRRLARRVIWEENRQRRFPMHLLGLGGIGANVVTHLAGLPNTPQKFLIQAYDMDTLEVHNLNRTWLYAMNDVGKTKTRAAKHQANQRPLRGWGDELLLSEVHEGRVTAEDDFPMGLILDCRDTMDPDVIHARTWLKLAYNGGETMAFYFRPSLVLKTMITARSGNAYEVIPSFYVPASIVALLGLVFTTYLNFLEIPDERAGVYVSEIDEVVTAISYQGDDEPWPEVEPQPEAAVDEEGDGDEFDEEEEDY